MAVDQNIRDGVAGIVHAGPPAGDEHRRFSALKSAQLHLLERGHRGGQPGGGLKLKAAVGAVPVIIARKTQPRLRIVAAQDHQLQIVVPIQIRHFVAGIGSAHQPGRLQIFHAVDADGLHLCADLPADQDFPHAVSVQIVIADAVDGGAAAIDDGSLLVPVVHGLENIDFQGPLLAVDPEEAQRLVHAVSVQINHLHRRQVSSRQGGRVFRAQGQRLRQAGAQGFIFIRQLGKGVEVVHRCGHHAPGQQQRQNRRCQ